MNLSRQIITRNQSWTAPAGVTSVRATLVVPQQVITQSNECNFALAAGNKLYGWGQNNEGQTGTNTAGGTNTSSPIAVVGGLSFSSFACNASNALGLTTNGSCYCWGLNTSGQLGNGNITAQSSPVLVVGGLTFQSVTLGLGIGLGLTLTGAAYAWGLNSTGQLGNNSSSNTSSPVAVVGGLTFQSFATDILNQSVIGITSAGAAYAWGNNAYGQLGDGTVTSRSSPVAVLGGLTFQTISMGNGNVVGLTTAGSLYCWGLNTSGQLGDGTATTRSSPVLVVGGLTFQSAAAAQQSGSSFGLTTTGALYGWGQNASGQLGVGNTTVRSSPTLVVGGLSVAAFSLSGSQSNMLLTTAGQAYGWGDNTYGEIGDGTSTSRSSPVLVVGGLSFAAIAAGGGSCNGGVTTDGLLYNWGFNTVYGTIGDGTSTPRSSPVAVVGGLLGMPPAAGSYNSIAVTPGTAYTIAVGTYMCKFGSTIVGYGGGTQKYMILEYFQ